MFVLFFLSFLFSLWYFPSLIQGCSCFMHALRRHSLWLCVCKSFCLIPKLLTTNIPFFLLSASFFFFIIIQKALFPTSLQLSYIYVNIFVIYTTHLTHQYSHFFFLLFVFFLHYLQASVSPISIQLLFSWASFMLSIHLSLLTAYIQSNQLGRLFITISLLRGYKTLCSSGNM